MLDRKYANGEKAEVVENKTAEEIVASEAWLPGLVMLGLGISGLVLETRVLRGAFSHPNGFVRAALLADVVADAGIIGWTSSKEQTRKKFESADARRERLDKVRPLTVWRGVNVVRTGVVQGLASSARRSPRGAAVRGLVGLVYSVAVMLTMRSLHPRMRRVARAAEEVRAKRGL